MPQDVANAPVVDVFALVFPPVETPLMKQFLIVLLLALVIADEVASRITEVYVMVLAAVLVIVRLRFVPAEPALSPSIVTLSAPLSSIRPRPWTEGPEMVTASAVGLMVKEV
jgi:hypothetical protein